MRRVEWEKTKISDKRFDSALVFDGNNDGNLDIESGGYLRCGVRTPIG